jgi:hypothetical protein
MAKGVLERISRAGSRRAFVTKGSVDALLHARVAMREREFSTVELLARIIYVERRLDSLEFEKHPPRARRRPKSSAPSKPMSDKELRRLCEQESIELPPRAAGTKLPPIPDPYNNPAQYQEQ